jgi:hypothetical protein
MGLLQSEEIGDLNRRAPALLWPPGSANSSRTRRSRGELALTKEEQ